MSADQSLQTTSMCEFGESVLPVLKKFRFAKKECSSAIILKIEKDDTIVIEDEMEDCSMEEVAEELPERTPRYVVYSYRWLHDDGRKSFPLCFILYLPEGCHPKANVLYTGSRNKIVDTLKLPKSFTVRDKESISEDWLKAELKK